MFELRTVTAPDGTRHEVRIEWIGNKLRRTPQQFTRRVRRMARSGKKFEPGFDGCVFDLEELFVAVIVIVAAVVLVLLVLPLAWGLLELLLVVVLAAAVWSFRVLFRRPWSVVHRGPGEVTIEDWHVVGWRQAHRVMVEAADTIERHGSARVGPPPGGWSDAPIG